MRRAAAALVSEGVSVSCAWDIENTHEPDHAMGTPQRFMVMTGESAAAQAERGARMAGALEFFGLVYHGYAITHLDSLCHIFWDGQMYNGKPAHLVNSMAGATHHAITELKDGIVTRGVMLDIAALKGVDWMGPVAKASSPRTSRPPRSGRASRCNRATPCCCAPATASASARSAVRRCWRRASPAGTSPARRGSASAASR